MKLKNEVEILISVFSIHSFDSLVFPGQGSMLFGANTTEESDESTFAFKPIVKLLPVETKTGEEDEDILFCERAKLYRFDSSTNEMKRTRYW